MTPTDLLSLTLKGLPTWTLSTLRLIFDDSSPPLLWVLMFTKSSTSVSGSSKLASHNVSANWKTCPPLWVTEDARKDDKENIRTSATSLESLKSYSVLIHPRPTVLSKLRAVIPSSSP